MTIEVHLEANPPYIIAPVDGVDAAMAAENALPRGWCIGEAWCESSPDQKQTDERWLLYVRRLTAAEMPFDERPADTRARASIVEICDVCGKRVIFDHHHPR